MKILIIRHCDPDYEIDGLTEKGKKEAELLTARLLKENVTAVYCSTLGRARHTAQPLLDAIGLNCTYHDWLREFSYELVQLPYLSYKKAPWDFLPEFVNENPELYSPTEWRNVDIFKVSGVPSAYDNVCAEFDKVLEHHGYKRNGCIYDVTNSNHDVIAFFCHFGLAAQLISHLMNCSPLSIAQNTFLPPSSVTAFFSEERRDGVAHFRAHGIGDISHLYHGDEEPSFSGRFCECFLDDTRHDKLY